MLSLSYLFTSDIKSILHFWKKRHTIGKNSLLIAKNSQLMKNFLRFYHNFNINDQYRITVPHFCNVSRKKMASLFAKELSSHNIDRKIIAFIVKRISIVYKYAPSIKDILNSANTAAENFNKDNPPLVMCL